MNERRCIARDVYGLYGSIVTLATYKNAASSSQALPTDDIVRALKQCVVEHPVLSTAIQDAETDNPQLVRVSLMDLSKHMQVIESVDWNSDAASRVQYLLERVHNEAIVDEKDFPPWRVYIVPLTSTLSSHACFQLAFASSHALVDGISGLTFHSTFLRALRDAKKLQFNSDYVFDLRSDTELPQALEHAATCPISWSFLLRPAMNEFLPSWLVSAFGMRDSRSENAWCGSSTRPLVSNSAKLLTTAAKTEIIPPHTLRKALEICRSRSSRLTALLAHIAAHALAKALRTQGKYYNSLIADIAMNLRRCIPDTKNCMANYVSAALETIDISPNSKDTKEALSIDDWESIRKTTQHLSAASSTLADQPVALLRYISSIRDWVLKQASKPPSSSFGLSNIGSVSANDDNTGRDWTVEEVAFSQSADGIGPPLNVNVASIKGGAMVIVITWQPEMLGVEDEQKLVEDALRYILQDLEKIAEAAGGELC